MAVNSGSPSGEIKSMSIIQEQTDDTVSTNTQFAKCSNCGEMFDFIQNRCPNCLTLNKTGFGTISISSPIKQILLCNIICVIVYTVFMALLNTAMSQFSLNTLFNTFFWALRLTIPITAIVLMTLADSKIKNVVFAIGCLFSSYIVFRSISDSFFRYTGFADQIIENFFRISALTNLIFALITVIILVALKFMNVIKNYKTMLFVVGCLFSGRIAFEWLYLSIVFGFDNIILALIPPLIAISIIFIIIFTGVKNIKERTNSYETTNKM